MKKIKLFMLISSIALLIPLTSCDLSNIFKDSTKDRTEQKDDNKEDDKKDDDNKDDNKENIDDNKEEIESYDLNLYLSDYKNKYGYKALGEDLEHGDIMQKAYVDFYNASKELLLSEENYELSESTTDGITTKFINVFESEDLEDINIIDYYKSAWSVFISENPIFYFLSNGYLARTKTSTEIRKNSAGEIIEQKDIKTYTFILVGYDNFNLFKSRDEINKKLVSLFIDTNALKDETEDYKKVTLINSYLKDNLEYAYKSDGITPEDSYWAHNILGLLNNKKGVCECYAKSFKLLSDYYNLNSISVYGQTKKNEAHAWNYVCIGENWYGMDVTWNDSTNKDNYLLCSDSKMKEDHIPYNNLEYDITYQPLLPNLSDAPYQI